MKSKSIILIFLLLSFNGFSQKNEQKENLNKKLKNAAKEIMISGSCTLITIDETGIARARAMDPFLPEDDFTVWFGTNAKSRKVKQIKNDARVTLYYLDSDGLGYVTIHGMAQLVDGLKEKEKWWKKEWKAFYPNKDEDYLLIKVTPIWMEILSPPRGINNNPTTWQPPTVYFEQK